MSGARHARPTEPTTASRATRLSIAMVVAVAALLVLGGGVAFGYFPTSSAKPAKALAGSVGTGAKPTAVVSGRDVTLSWSAATNASGCTIAGRTRALGRCRRP